MRDFLCFCFSPLQLLFTGRTCRLWPANNGELRISTVETLYIYRYVITYNNVHVCITNEAACCIRGGKAKWYNRSAGQVPLVQLKALSMQMSSDKAWNWSQQHVSAIKIVATTQKTGGVTYDRRRSYAHKNRRMRLWLQRHQAANIPSWADSSWSSFALLAPNAGGVIDRLAVDVETRRAGHRPGVGRVGVVRHLAAGGEALTAERQARPRCDKRFAVKLKRSGIAAFC